jgi:regulator of protease activity HflC (stomatin/prohibitin superfamily)
MYDDEEKKKYLRNLILTIVGGLLGLSLIIFLVFGVYRVPAGHVGVITRFGAVNRVANPGVGLKIPLVEGRRLMSAQTQKIELQTEAGSSNLQAVTAIVSVNYKIVANKAADLYQEVGTEYEDIIIKPQIEEAFKAATAKFTAEDTIIKRTELSDNSQEVLQKALEPFYIIVQTFNIENIDFSPEYDASIEAKQVQEQKVKIAELKQQEAKINAETALIEARGIANAQKELSQTGALSQSYLQYLFLTNWNGILPQVIGGADPVFDIGDYLPEP